MFSNRIVAFVVLKNLILAQLKFATYPAKMIRNQYWQP